MPGCPFAVNVWYDPPRATGLQLRVAAGNPTEPLRLMQLSEPEGDLAVWAKSVFRPVASLRGGQACLIGEQLAASPPGASLRGGQVGEYAGGLAVPPVASLRGGQGTTVDETVLTETDASSSGMRSSKTGAAPCLSMVARGHMAGRRVRVLFDTGASSVGFIAERLVVQLGLQRQVDHASVKEIVAFDGRVLVSSGTVTRTLKLGGLKVEVTLVVVPLDDSLDIILGNEWMLQHHCVLNFATQSVFASTCGKVYSISVTPFQPGSEDLALGKSPPPKEAASPNDMSKDILSVALARRLIGQGVKFYLLFVGESSKVPEPARDLPVSVDQGGPGTVDASDGTSVVDMCGLVGDPSTMNPPGVPSYLSGGSLVGESDVQALLEECPYELQDLPVGLPPLRPTAHTIPLVDGACPVYRRAYCLSVEERKSVQEYVERLVQQGWIVPSTSPWSTPVILTSKPDGTMRVCVDYRALNDLTVKNRYPLPRIDDLLDSLAGASVFSALDLASGYWQIRLSEEDAAKTGFSTPFGHYEWKVLPMGLSNAPATFQAEMNRIFKNKGLGQYVAVYLDDILVYSRTLQEHLEHLRLVLQVLREHQYKCKPTKCQFGRTELKTLGTSLARVGSVPTLPRWTR